MTQSNNVCGRIFARNEPRGRVGVVKVSCAALSARGKRLGFQVATTLTAGLLFIGFGVTEFFVAHGTADAQTSQREAQRGPKVQPVDKDFRPTPHELAAQTAVQSAGELFLEHAGKAGVSGCAATYAELGAIVTAGATFSVQTRAAAAGAPSRGIQGLVGMNYSNPADYTGPASAVVLAVPTDKGCEGISVRVVPFPQNCSVAQTLLPQGSTALDPLSGLPVFALATGGQAMFTPTTSGCVVVSIVRVRE